MKAPLFSRPSVLSISLLLIVLLGLLAGCPRKDQKRGVTAPVYPPAVVLNVGEGAISRAKVTGLTVAVADQASGAVVDTQTFADPAFPLSLELDVTIPPCLYTITATAVLRDGSNNSASAVVDACAFAGEALTLAIVTEEPTPTPTAIPTAIPINIFTVTPIPMATPTNLPTVIPTAIPTLIPTATPTLIPTATPTLIPTATPPSYQTICTTNSPQTAGGYDWYCYDVGTNCNTVCSNYGLTFNTDPLAIDYYNADLAGCQNIITTLGLSFTSSASNPCATLLGCHLWLDGTGNQANTCTDAPALDPMASGASDLNICPCTSPPPVPLTYPGATHTESDCAATSGTVYDTAGNGTLCQIAMNDCPAGWTRADNWHRMGTNAELTVGSVTYCTATPVYWTTTTFQNTLPQQLTPSSGAMASISCATTPCALGELTKIDTSFPLYSCYSSLYGAAVAIPYGTASVMEVGCM